MAAGTCGRQAPPATAHSTSTADGARRSAATTSAATASACPAAAARSTGGWPSRSINRPCATAPRALASPNAPATRPASANDPVASRASSRIARMYMPIGSDPSADATTGPRAPGTRSRAQ